MPVVVSIENGQRLDDIEVEKVERGKAPGAIEQPIYEDGQGQYSTSTNDGLLQKDHTLGL